VDALCISATVRGRGGREDLRDLTLLVVPVAGALEETSDRWLPFRLVDPAGAVVKPVSAFFADLQAAGRSASASAAWLACPPPASSGRNPGPPPASPCSTAPRPSSYFDGGPVVAGGTVYIGSYNGKVYALAAVTGKVRSSYAASASVLARPAVAGGVVYIGSADGKVYARIARASTSNDAFG
jgi:hypothetical protein